MLTMDVFERIAVNLKVRRKEKRLSRKRLSELSTVAAITIKKIEAGQYNPSIKILSKLARALQVELTDLIS